MLKFFWEKKTEYVFLSVIANTDTLILLGNKQR